MIVGGQSRISLGVLSEPDTVRTKGVSARNMMNTATARNTIRERLILRPGRGATTAAGSTRARRCSAVRTASGAAISDRFAVLARSRAIAAFASPVRSLVVRRHVEVAALDQRHYEDHDKEDHAERAGVAHVQVAEALAPQ